MERSIYKRPESVLVVVHTRDGQVLVMERASPRGFWQSVTGSLREGESAERAAWRELREETGLQAGQLIDCQRTNCFTILPEWRSRYAPEVQENTEYVFRFQVEEAALPLLSQSEHVRAQWLPRDEAASRVSSWTNRDAILDFVPEPVNDSSG
ncbi:MAG: dihydroneopterin triphosphate diphosphatase [Granulosicoccaceae bacterium]